MTKQADFKRRVRARMAKTGESYAAARSHLLAEPGPDPATWMTDALHVSNGDATDLPGTGLARRVLYWRDVLHEGPVPAVDAEELRRIRAAFLIGAGQRGSAGGAGQRGSAGGAGQRASDDRREADAMFVERDRTLADNRDGEYVLWFEADLYDQLQIIQILARLAELGVPAERVTLICIGEHAGIARFGGLGELTAEQLRELPSTNACARLTSAAYDLATRAWATLRSTTPEGLAGIAATRSGELRFLGEAFDRLSREYPSTRDGLSLTERRVLAGVADGATDAGSAFERAWRRETRPYLGDTWCFAMMDRMARAPHPLLRIEPADRNADRFARLWLTDAGARVLAGEADHVALNGIDRWIGGVHLHGRDVRWRWDDARETIVDTSH
jgi:hypothetical protein